MSETKRPTTECYREAAERLRQLARECWLADIQADLLDLSARFERMAAYYAAQTPSDPRDRDGRSIIPVTSPLLNDLGSRASAKGIA
jgi:hypothetical protein